jgi:hypothetical protein
MSHFYGTLRGNRGEATRAGSKDSGVITHTASWQGAVVARAFYDEETGKDFVAVRFTDWHGRGTNKEIYVGPIDGSGDVLTEDTRLLTHVVDETVNKAKKNSGSVTITLPKDIYEKIRERIIKKVVHSS